MLAPISTLEEFYGAIPDYDSTIFCEKCGNFIVEDEPYIEKWDGKVMCADCIESNTAEMVLDFVGYDNIFDILEKLGKLEYVG